MYVCSSSSTFSGLAAGVLADFGAMAMVLSLFSFFALGVHVFYGFYGHFFMSGAQGAGWGVIPPWLVGTRIGVTSHP